MDLVATRHGLAALTVSREGPDGVVLVLHGLGRSSAVEALLPPGLTVAHLELPAYVGPTFPRYDAATIAQAYDDVVAARFADRRVVVVGISMGAVIGLGMTAPQIGALLAVEPFLDSDRPELYARLRDTLLRTRPDTAALLRDLLGYDAERLAPRAYAVRCPAPTRVLAGDGTPSQLASLCTSEDRRRLAALGASVTTANSGHDVLHEDPAALRAALAWALDAGLAPARQP